MTLSSVLEQILAGGQDAIGIEIILDRQTIVYTTPVIRQHQIYS